MSRFEVKTMENNDIQVSCCEMTLQELIERVECNIDPSRERSLVITKLEEALMWLGKCRGSSE